VTDDQRPERHFDELLTRDRVFVFGASTARRGPLAFLKSHGLPVAALADNNPALHGKIVDGLEVLSATQLVGHMRRLDAVVIASAYQLDIFLQLVEHLHIPVSQVFPYVDELVYAACRPEPLAAARDELDMVSRCLGDVASQRYFQSLIAYRSHLDPRGFVRNTEVRRQYAYGSFDLPARGDVILDGGAADGETAAAFLAQCQRDCTVVCVEALPSNVVQMRDRLADAISAGTVRVVAAALAAGPGELFLEDSVSGSEANMLARVVTGSGEADLSSLVRVEATTIDAVCATGLDFLKLDIEGSEELALEGGREAISRFAPAIALSAYHRAQDIWRLPQLIKELLPSSLVFAAHHPLTLHEIEFFFVPKSRI